MLLALTTAGVGPVEDRSRAGSYKDPYQRGDGFVWKDDVFGRFVRLSGSEVEGSGLGLAIVKAIADRCGAQVALINRQDRSGLVARVAFASANLAEIH